MSVAVTRPTLLNSCGLAATAAEARFRIQGVSIPPRRARVIALDRRAVETIARCQEDHPLATWWFALGEPTTANGTSPPPLPVLVDGLGRSCTLDDALEDADVIVLVATGDEGAPAAATIGAYAQEHGIMTSGLLLDLRGVARAALRALRPYAQVLLRSADEADLPDMLTALRA